MSSNPKSEGRNPKEGRIPKSELAMRRNQDAASSGAEYGRQEPSGPCCLCGRVKAGSFGLRIPAFLRISVLGLRISQRDSNKSIHEAAFATGATDRTSPPQGLSPGASAIGRGSSTDLTPPPGFAACGWVDRGSDKDCPDSRWNRQRRRDDRGRT